MEPPNSVPSATKLFWKWWLFVSYFSFSSKTWARCGHAALHTMLASHALGSPIPSSDQVINPMEWEDLELVWTTKEEAAEISDIFYERFELN